MTLISFHNCWPEFAIWHITTQKCQKIQCYHVPRREEKKKYLPKKCEWLQQAFLLAVKTAMFFPQEIRIKQILFVSILPKSLESSSLMTPSETLSFITFSLPALFLSSLIPIWNYIMFLLFYTYRHIFLIHKILYFLWHSLIHWYIPHP